MFISIFGFTLFGVGLMLAGLEDKKSIFNLPSTSILIVFLTIVFETPLIFFNSNIIIFNLTTIGLLSIILLYLLLLKNEYFLGILDIVFILSEGLIILPIIINGYYVSFVIIHLILTMILISKKIVKGMFVPFLYYHFISFLLLVPIYCMYSINL